MYDSITRIETHTVPLPYTIYRMAVDPALRKVYMVSNDGSFSVYDANTNNLTNYGHALIVSGESPADMAVDPNNHLLFITFPINSSLVVVNGYTDEAINQIVLNSPTKIAVKPSNNLVYVAEDTDVAVVSSTTGGVVTRITNSFGAMTCTDIVADPCSGRFFASYADENGLGGISVIHDYEQEDTISTLGGAIALAIDPSLNQLYVSTDAITAISVYNTCSLESITQLSMSAVDSGRKKTVDTRNHLLYASDVALGIIRVFDSVTLTQAPSISAPNNLNNPMAAMACFPGCAAANYCLTNPIG